jgi:putative toxin-antitoxin system antitoxin component (TIGR02293 family)
VASPNQAAAAMQQKYENESLAQLQALAEEVFGDKTMALDWLQQPNLATDGRPPIDLLSTSDGFERVKNLLLRIEYGVLA